MTALGARRNMATERSGPTSLNGRHYFELRQVQVSGMVLAIGSTMRVEDIRDLQFGAGHRSRGLSGPGFPAHQQIKRAGDIPDRLGGHLRVDRHRFQLGVPQQHLDHPNVGPAFE